MKRFSVLACAFALVACQPSDVKVKTVRQVLESGGKVDFTENGFRYGGCGGADWTDLRVSSETERQQIVLGNQQSALNAGMYSCFRVGSLISITSPDKKGVSAGLVRITKLSWVQLANLQSLKGQIFASAESFNAYKNSFKDRLKPDQNGLVTVLEFSYKKGSAADEKSIDDRDGSQDGYVETNKDGDVLSTCKSPWNDVYIDASVKDAIQSGQLQSWYELGDKNCIPQGQAINLRLSSKDPVLFTGQAIKVKRFKVSALDAKFFRLNGFNFDSIKTLVTNENLKKAQLWMTVVDFNLNSTVVTR